MTWSFPCRWQMVGPGLAAGRVNGMIRLGTSRTRAADMTQHATKYMPCRTCGELVQVSIRTQKQPQCIECGIAVHAEVVQNMLTHSGPYWDKWVENHGNRGRPRSRSTPIVERPKCPPSETCRCRCHASS